MKKIVIAALIAGFFGFSAMVAQQCEQAVEQFGSQSVSGLPAGSYLKKCDQCMIALPDTLECKCHVGSKTAAFKEPFTGCPDNGCNELSTQSYGENVGLVCIDRCNGGQIIKRGSFIED